MNPSIDPVALQDAEQELEPGPHRRSELLIAWAREEGFDRAGVASLEPSRHGAFYRRWLAAEHHAGMAWMEQRLAERDDPARLLPGARSALCVALQYHPLEDEAPVEGDLWPWVARYARGRDYHDIMGKGLGRLAGRMRQAFPGAETRPYVDTGPIRERELAERAGLGGVGKHTNLLHRRWGSWFLVGEILTTLELAPGVPVGDLCGHCSRCLDACPTGALPEPYRLDSRRCISYWTIEHRGDLPDEAREMVGQWVFGCDICQEVCPWNHRPRRGEPLPGTERRLGLPEERRQLDLAGLLALDREGYVERFQVAAMKRAKLEGLQRNAAVAMGHRRDPVYVPDLGRALSENPSPVVRRHAAWALGRIGGGEARSILRAVLDARRDDQAALPDGEEGLALEREIVAALTMDRAPETPAEGARDTAEGGGPPPKRGGVGMVDIEDP